MSQNSAQNLVSLPYIAGRVPSQKLPSTRPILYNQFDRCLMQEKEMWDEIMEAGLDTVCCPKGRKPYPLRPWVVQPENGRRFRKIGSFAVAGATYDGTTQSVVLQYNVPIGYDAVIDTVVCNINANGATGFTEGSGQLTWVLFANLRHLEDMGDVEFSLGSLITPIPTPGSGLRVYSGNQITFSVIFSVAAAGVINPAATIVCATYGWEYSR